MNKFLLTLSLVLGLLFTVSAFEEHDHENLRIDYVNPEYMLISDAIQSELRQHPVWQNFISNQGVWYVRFNQSNGLPHRAMGAPIYVGGATPTDKALNFINDNFDLYSLPLDEIRAGKEIESPNFYFANFYQVHQGMNVIDSRLMVKMTKDGGVIQFGMDVHSNIELSTDPVIGLDKAKEIAATDIHGDLTINAEDNLSILPIPLHRSYDYRRVYTLVVEQYEDGNEHGNYSVYVDAVTGEILSRYNRIQATGLTINGESSPGSLPSTPTIEGLPYLDVTIGGTPYQTNIDGVINVPFTGSQSANVRLQGEWARVYSGGSTPSFTTTVDDTDTVLSTVGEFSAEEVTPYLHTNIIHDYMKGFFPTFTSLDDQITINVEQTGVTCNATFAWFSNTMNHYAEGGGCYSLALLPDVTYHEYGHGITGNFYNDYETGTSPGLDNGAIGEGYSDVWALAITDIPILGEGWQIGAPTSSVRRYDMAPKVYPQDLAGQVHNDGEIICGAWWALRENLNSIPDMMALHTETYWATPDGPNGTEGVVYTDILEETLLIDDAPANGGDNDITNGTPNDSLIIDAFQQHGITLVASADLDHTPVIASTFAIPITISAQAVVPNAWALNNPVIYYDVNSAGNWQKADMTLTSGITYEGEIPAQSPGTIVSYYIGLEDIFGNISSVLPAGAENAADPNLPYFVMVGFTSMDIEDFDTQQGNWKIVVPGDNATTGTWEINLPIASYGDPTNQINICQPGTQVTSGGFACVVTENASNAQTSIGTNDVDAGKTTLETPALDLTGYNEPAISYFRWFVNAHANSANPGQDYWQVYISNDNSNWLNVEKTRTQDISWRRNVIKVSDYVTPNSTVYLRFEASDSTRLGQNLDGGSLIEAAVDDLEIWETQTIGIEEEDPISSYTVHPNPATDHLTVSIDADHIMDYDIRLMDISGKHVGVRKNGQLNVGANEIELNFNLSSGIYLLRITYEGRERTERISIQ